MWSDVNLKTFEFEQRPTSIENGPVGRVFDLFDDKSVELVNIPGHTPGLAAMKLNENEKTVLLFSDGGYATSSWNNMIMPGITNDDDLARKSLKWIRDVSSKKNCVESLANHDCDVKPHVITL